MKKIIISSVFCRIPRVPLINFDNCNRFFVFAQYKINLHKVNQETCPMYSLQIHVPEYLKQHKKKT